jgi:hypothetical protein
MNTKQKLTAAVGLVAILAALGVAGEGDYQEAVRQEQEYQKMVCTGVWPNYKRIPLKCEGK